MSKIGLLQHVQRNSSGHRDYTNKDLQWIEFVNRLKDTGMPLAEIQQQHLAMLEDKINLYKANKVS